MMQSVKIVGFIGLVLVALAAGPFQQRISQWWYEVSRPDTLPELTILESQSTIVQDEGQEIWRLETEVIRNETDTQSTNLLVPQSADSIPTELNLDVPFTSQAPHANWDARHEEYCEEASALMVGRYFQSRSIDGPDEADAAMLELEQWQLQQYGYFESTTAEETAAMIQDVYGLVVDVSTDVTSDSIKRALASQQLVIIPAAGRQLGNPYFQRPGPIYHMLVIKGYTPNGKFITNDPGTRHGADFVYDENQLLGAVGDYNHGDPANGEQVMVKISKS